MQGFSPADEEILFRQQCPNHSLPCAAPRLRGGRLYGSLRFRPEYDGSGTRSAQIALAKEVDSGRRLRCTQGGALLQILLKGSNWKWERRTYDI